MFKTIKKTNIYDAVTSVYAYMGHYKGYRYISECINDNEITDTAVGALNEMGEALFCAFNLSESDLETWKKKILIDIDDLSKKTPDYLGANPISKLKPNGRLIGPTIFCKDYGIWPYYLTKAVAYAFLFENKMDTNSVILKEFTDYYGIKAAVQKYCGLEMEPELQQMIKKHYDREIEGMDAENKNRITIMKRAYHNGFMSEKKFKGCAQCVLHAFFELTGNTNEMLFQSASGFSGGMAISGDGVCGGYSGGVMYMGSFVGRKVDEMITNEDKDSQYISYEMAQKLRDRFLETYGSVICSDIHKRIFGKSFCLRTKAIRNNFEEAGAHTNKCTNVVGTSCVYIAEILYDYGYLKL